LGGFRWDVRLLFNVLHPSGIELKVRPSYEKAPATQAAPPPAQGTASYDGWASPEKATASNGSQTARPKVTTPTTLAEWQALFPHISLVGAQAAYADKNTVFIDSRKRRITPRATSPRPSFLRG
jgi:hypothetical protein